MKQACFVKILIFAENTGEFINDNIKCMICKLHVQNLIN